MVGSGPGGGPLAARLAIAGHKVLLIDAGDDQGASIPYQVPALHPASTEYDPMKWDYYVNHYSDLTRQAQDSKMTYETPSGDRYIGADPPAGSKPLGIWYPRAGTLGGCGSHNALISIYPHRSDWSYIASLTGDESWSPDNMRTYFERLENAQYLPNSAVGHGFNGWLTISLTSLGLVSKDNKLIGLIAAAAAAWGKSTLGIAVKTVTGLGQILARDINAGTPGRDAAEGLYQVPIAVAGGARNGPREFVLNTANAKNRDGSRKYQLDIRLQTLVTKIRFDQSGPTPRAIGVDFLTGQSLYKADPRSGSAAAGTPGAVNATREVIISTGAFNTPQLLKLSGIGPTAELSSFGIPTIVDLPGVGTNLQDRYETTIIAKTTSDFVTTKNCKFFLSSPDQCLQQWQHPTLGVDRGTYATNGLAIAIVKKSSAAAEGDDPDLLISGVPAAFKGYYEGYSRDGFADARTWSWITLKAHSRNRAGTVTLRSADPRDTPLINFNYLDSGTNADGEAARDLQAVTEGMVLSRKIFAQTQPGVLSTPFVLSGGSAFEEVWPGGNVTGPELASFAAKEAWGHHASCTCPIGADGDPMAVLDSRFRVRGTQGLRVVDASVFPKIPGFYLAVPVYMISEKGADAVLADAADMA